jgi:hypothetical protein
MGYADYKAGMKAATAGKPLPDNASDDFTFGYRHELRHTRPGGNHDHLEYADANHDHQIEITGRTT